MKCAKCGRRLRKGYEFEGQIYGPVCVKKMGLSVTQQIKMIPFALRAKDFRGGRVEGVPVVIGDGLPIKPRLDLCNHSPDGFEWGYEGSGPAQLALAILAAYLGPKLEERAVALHQLFKKDVIAKLAKNEPWHITEQMLIGWMKLRE